MTSYITTSLLDIFKIGPGPSSSHTISPMKAVLAFRHRLVSAPADSIAKINLIWVGVGIGVLPLTLGSNSILQGFQQGLPATVPLGKILANPLFSSVAMAFSLTAICTSYAANGIGLMDFNRDLLGGGSRLTIIMATFLPPLAIALLFPSVFLKAIGIFGGAGISLLFGVLPAVIFLSRIKIHCQNPGLGRRLALYRGPAH